MLVWIHNLVLLPVRLRTAGTANKTLGANIWFAFGELRNSVRYAHFITAFHPLATRKLIMTLSQTIHDVWKTNRLLYKRIPPEFLTYNFSPYERLPRAAFTIKDQTVAARTNHGITAEKATVQFTILDVSFADAIGMVGQMQSSYDGKTFDLVENKLSVALALNNFNITHENGCWKAVVNYDVSVFTYNPSYLNEQFYYGCNKN